MSTDRGDADTASYDSSSSSSSEDTVLITKKDRQKLQIKQKEREAVKSEDSTAPRGTPTGGKSPAAGAKVDHICGVCEKEGGVLYVCTGSCVSAYHLDCLHLSAGRDPPPRDEWKCPSCLNSTHVCFHCKQLGVTSGDTAVTPGAPAAVGSTDAKSDLRAVVKCRALSCGKYYHQDCIAKLPLARIAGSRFICPLHTCAACEQSGAKKEPVRCTRCPVAYHTSCLPRSGVFHLPGKRIICPKHDVPPNMVTQKAENEGAAESKQLPVLKRVASVEDDLSVAASSPRTEDNDDVQSDASGTHGSSKKHSKSSKKDKKKKKKKRKKEKKKEKHRGDEEDGEGFNSKKSKDVKEGDSKVEYSVDESRGVLESSNVDKIAIPRDDNEDTGDVAAKSSSSGIKMENLLSEQTPRSERLSIGSADLETTEVFEHDQVKQSTGSQISSDDAARDHVFPGESAMKTTSSYSKETTLASISDKRQVETVKEAEEEDEGGHEAERNERRQSSSYQSSPLDETMNDSVSTPRGARGSDGDEADDAESRWEKSRHVSDAMKERSSSSRSRKSKKKKKGRTGDSKRANSGVDGEDDDNDDERTEDEAKWVQCDECKKWRTVPKEIDLDAMPETWYCKMNTWDRSYASCSVPEEVVETKKKSGKRLSSVITDGAANSSTKKAKLSRQSSAADVTNASEVNDNTVDKDKGGNKLVKKADKDSKKRKLKLKLKEKYGEVKWVQCENAACGKWRVVPPSIDFDLLPSVWYCNLNTWSSELASCSAPNPFEVEAYLSKSQSKKPASSRPAKRHKGQDQAGSEAVSTPVAALPKLETVKSNSKAGKNTKGSTPTAHMGGTGVNSSASTSHIQSQVSGDDGRGKKVGALEGVRSVVLEWAMCEKCQKWRKLPPHIKSSTLPDKWYCSMNHWDPSRASCSIPQEEDQEPVDASPLPSSQNWYPMPGQVGATTSTGGGSGRTKRGKLSYSELLYANTGQLRKTYTSESSTLTFEYEGVTYFRDDQYKRSCMYISPLTTNKLTGEPVDLQSQASKGRELAVSNTVQFIPVATQQVIDNVAKVILEKIDLRHDHSIMDIVESVYSDCTSVDRDNLSLSVITSALSQLVNQGEVEKVDRRKVKPIDRPEADTSSSAAILLASLSSQPAYYRKVPRRPLKALKAWKHAEINIS